MSFNEVEITDEMRKEARIIEKKFDEIFGSGKYNTTSWVKNNVYLGHLGEQAFRRWLDDNNVEYDVNCTSERILKHADEYDVKIGNKLIDVNTTRNYFPKILISAKKLKLDKIDYHVIVVVIDKASHSEILGYLTRKELEERRVSTCWKGDCREFNPWELHDVSDFKSLV